MTTTMTTDLDLLRARMASAIGGQLPGHQVFLRQVEALDRDVMTGKARRFMPLHARPAGTAHA